MGVWKFVLVIKALVSTKILAIPQNGKKFRIFIDKGRKGYNLINK